MSESRQNAQHSLKRTPKAAAINSQKVAFLEELRANGGNVSNALEKSKLNRRTAYEHRGKDRRFADAWADVLEIVSDELMDEARNRALGYTNTNRGPQPYGKASDRLLIFLLQQGGAHMKWRNRVLQIGRVTIQTIQTKGKELGLSEEHIARLIETLLDEYQNVSLL